MDLLTEEEIDQLRSIAESIRERAVQTMYGYFRGGDPRDFTPDPEACSEDEMAEHARLCAKYEAGEIQHVEGHHHRAVMDNEGNIIGVASYAPLGMGTSCFADGEAEDLAAELDRWVDAVRKYEDKCR